MTLVPLKLPPGVYRNGTDYQARGRYFDANLIRWFEGTVGPVGGWVRPITTQLSGPGRGMLTWRANNSTRFCAIGTPNDLYIYNDDAVTARTPVGFPAGRLDTFYGQGYGFGDYGAGLYGRGGAGGKTDATTWAFDTFGEDLVAVASHEEVIHLWSPGDSVAAPLENAPSARSLFVTDERMIVALAAADNPRKVQWCDQENATQWTAGMTTTAGDFDIQTTGNLLTGLKVRGQYLLLTTTDAHIMRFIDYPLVYGFNQVADGCGLIASLAAQSLQDGAVWMGLKNFYWFNSSTIAPLPCEVRDYVFGDLNTLQAAKIASGHYAAKSEVWWWYPSADSTFNNRYVVWNYRENHWSIGEMSRGCWADEGVFRYPLAVSTDGYIYEHENGFTDDGATRVPDIFATSGPVEIGDGDQVMSVMQIIPDERTEGDAEVLIATRFTPEGPVFDYGPYTFEPYTDVRFSGRQAAIQLRARRDVDFRFGVLRFDGRARGRR